MSFACWRTALCCALLGVSAAATAAEGSLRERPVADVLRALSGPELQFLFSSELVPDNLLVGREPALPPEAASSPLDLARAVLGDLGLELREVNRGLYAVVRSLRPMPTPSEPVKLDELIVSASRYRLGDVAGAAVQMLDHSELADQPGPGEDPMRAMARLPGVLGDGLSAQTHVRGGETNEVLLLLDGFPLRRAFHMAGYQSPFSVVDAQLLKGADVYTGGFPARFGTRMSGVFDLHTIDPGSAPPHQVGVDFFNAGGYSQWRAEEGQHDALIAARIGTLSPLLRAIEPDIGNPRYGDGMVRLGLTTDEGLRISANLLLARDELYIADPRRGESAEIEDRVRYAWLHAQRPLGERGEAQVWFGQTDIDSFREGTVANSGISHGSAADRRSAGVWDLRAQARWRVDETLVLGGGAEYSQGSAHYRYEAEARHEAGLAGLLGIPASLNRDVTLHPEREHTALFTTLTWQSGSALTVDTGLRVLRTSQPNAASRNYAEPRIALRWQATGDTALYLNWGRFHQPGEVHEIEAGDGIDSLPPTQRSDHFIIGLRHSLQTGVALRAEAYSKQQSQPSVRFENLYNRRTILPEISPDRVAIAPTFAEIRGVEMSVELSHEALSGWATVQWSDATDHFETARVRRSWDPGWSLQAGGNWQHGPWRLGGALQIRNGFPATELFAPRNRARLPRVVDLGLRADFRQAVSRGELQYSVELQNALAQPNDCCSDLVTEAGSYRLRRLRGLPLLPSLGIRWSW